MAIKQALDAARGKDGCCAWIQGPAGIGKTSLAGEACRMGATGGFRVRRCIGAPLANRELRVVLRAMLRRFRFEPVDGPEETIRRVGATLAPSNGGRVVLRAVAAPSSRRTSLVRAIA